MSPTDEIAPAGTPTVSDAGLDLIFRNARSFSYWQDKPVSKALLQAVYELTRLGPTASNCCPARFVFITSDEGRERIKPHLIDSNVRKVMTAPVTAIIAYDTEFYEQVPKLFPHQPEARDWFTGSEMEVYHHALRNSSLQAAYFMIAARSLGLDCGPMGGFDKDGLDKEFFPDGKWKSNIICALGYGERSKLHARGPRLDFEETCKIV